MKSSYYKEGHDAFINGKSADTNSYQDDAEKKKEWETGWEDAKIGQDLERGRICREAD